MKFAFAITELFARCKVNHFQSYRYLASGSKGNQRKRAKKTEHRATSPQNRQEDENGSRSGPVITSPKLWPIMSYDQMNALRKAQAHRSVLIQVPGKFSCNHVHQMCSNFGKVNKMFYDSHVKDYMLIEFEDRESLQNLLAGADHFSNADVPTQTRVLYLINPGLDNKVTPTVPVQFDRTKGVKMTDLQNASSVTEQLQMFYQGERLTELGTRLRFFLCTLLEDSLSSLLPHVQVIPFGSSVNGFGKHTSDLDMILDLGKTPSMAKKMSHLKYMTKMPGDNDRHFVQRTLGVVGDILKVFLPHVMRVEKILEARVPIIHFFHEGLNVYCDLTLNNLSGLQMSEILYNVGAYTPQVHPLVFILQKWASLNQLTLNRPGPRFSNFMLMCMIIFFLQSRKPPALLPLKKFITNGATSSNPSILQDISPLPVSQNTQDLGELLIEFFQFYSTFDFTNFGLSILHGRKFPKTDDGAMQIENPFELGHNVTANVRLKELDYLQACLRTAATKLEQNWAKTQKPWGVMSLIDQQTLRNDVSVGFRVKELYTKS